jgi:hypothetical protein
VSDPMPVSKSVRQMSDEEILKTFDQLVEAWGVGKLRESS